MQSYEPSGNLPEQVEAILLDMLIPQHSAEVVPSLTHLHPSIPNPLLVVKPGVVETNKHIYLN